MTPRNPVPPLYDCHSTVPRTPGSCVGLDAIVLEACRAWPEIRVDPLRFRGHLKERLAALDGSLDALAKLELGDIYLAFACACHEPRALMELSRMMGRALPAVLRAGGDPAGVSDAFQVAREKLVLPREAERPKILSYAGRGRLEAWVRVTVVRCALDLRRAASAMPDEVGHRAVEEMATLASACDLHRDLLSRRYEPAFRKAFGAALASLSSEERTLLKMHYLEGLTIDQLAPVYRVHRATVARQVGRAKERLSEEVSRRLRAEFGMTRSEYASLVTELQSRLEGALASLVAGRSSVATTLPA